MAGAVSAPTTIVRARPDAMPLGMVLFLSSEVMFFAALFAGYFTLRSQADNWPPRGVDLDADLPIALVLTVILTISSLTIWFAERSAHRDRLRAFGMWTGVTLLLGLVFLAGKVYELIDAPVAIDADAYGSVWWTMLGLHGVHLLIGCTALFVVLGRLWQGAYRRGPDGEPAGLSGLTSVGYYWHFVDVVWILMFLVIWVVR